MPSSTATATATVTVVPVADELVGAALVFCSVWVRGCCLRPGGFLHRRVKRDIRQQAKKSSIQQELQRQLWGDNDKNDKEEDAALLHQALIDNDKEEDAAQLDKALVQFSGALVFLFVMMAILWFRIILERSVVQVLIIIMAILVANVIDQKAKTWEHKEEDVLKFRRQLQQSFLPPANYNNNECDGHDSDSSESYDPERHGNMHHHQHCGA